MAGFEVPPGMIAITTYGGVRAETVQSLIELKERCHELQLNNVIFSTVVATLVDKARNDTVRNFLANKNLQWLWFIDADMIVAKNAVDVMLATAYRDYQWADIVGGYCQLRGSPFLPTIDTGTGTWESTLPKQGILEVIRTGGACTLTKRHVFEAMERPWFGVRPAPRALDMLAEVDNYARIKFDGRNPFADIPAWEQLLKCARDDSGTAPTVAGERKDFSTVGEDSNFADRAKAHGFRIVVQTDLVVGHVDTKVIWPDDHAAALKEGAKNARADLGVTE